MSLWNPKKALNQPPHYRQVGQVSQPLRETDEERAEKALKDAQLHRDVVMRRNGMRATVKAN